MQSAVTRLALLNPMDPAVINQANFVLPVYDQVARLEVLGTDSELSISQYQYQTISWELCSQDAHAHPLGHAVLCVLQRRVVVRAIWPRLGHVNW